jgi:hypothetical protein
MLGACLLNCILMHLYIVSFRTRAVTLVCGHSETQFFLIRLHSARIEFLSFHSHRLADKPADAASVSDCAKVV